MPKVDRYQRSVTVTGQGPSAAANVSSFGEVGRAISGFSEQLGTIAAQRYKELKKQEDDNFLTGEGAKLNQNFLEFKTKIAQDPQYQSGNYEGMSKALADFSKSQLETYSVTQNERPDLYNKILSHTVSLENSARDSFASLASARIKQTGEVVRKADLESSMLISRNGDYALGITNYQKTLDAQRANGLLSPEAYDLAVKDGRSKIAEANIMQLAATDPTAAKAVYNAFNGEKVLLADTAERLDKMLKPLATKQTGMNTALELGAGFAGITNPLELNQAVEKAVSDAQTKLKDNPDALNLAETQLLQMASRREYGIKIERAEAVRPINLAMAKARQEGRIPSLADFDNGAWANLLNTDPDKADDILRNIQNETRMDADRRQAKIDRAEAKQDRAEARAERETLKAERAATKKRQDDNYARLWGNPAALADTDIEGMVGMGDLSPEDGKKLEVRQRSYDPAHILAEAKDVAKVLRAANIRPESDDERAVKKYVADRIALSKEKPTSEQVTQFAREALAEVDIPWRLDKPAYKMTIADVPKAEADKIRDALSRRGRSVSDAMIVQIYTKRGTR